MKYTEDEIDCLTNFLSDFVENNNLDVNYFIERYNLSVEKVEYLLKSLQKLNKEVLNLFVSQVFDDGSFVIVSLNSYECKKFLAQGGFKKYFSKNEFKANDVILVANAGVIGNINQSEQFVVKDKISLGSFVKVSKEKHKVLVILEKYWWAIVIPLLVTIIGLWIENKYFKK